MEQCDRAGDRRARPTGTGGRVGGGALGARPVMGEPLDGRRHRSGTGDVSRTGRRPTTAIRRTPTGRGRSPTRPGGCDVTVSLALHPATFWRRVLLAKIRACATAPTRASRVTRRAGLGGDTSARRMTEIVTFVDEGLGHSSFLVDLGDGRALVIDPPRFADRQLAEARARGLEIAVTADTHSHADYVSGSPGLAARGADFLASKGAHLEVAHHPVVAGDEIELGDGLVLRAIATPGHTPDHLAYLLCENDRPTALFSGGSLMVGTVGRTDLLGPEPREDLARRLYRALRDEILTLPDDLAVYPTHGAGSFCSAPGASDAHHDDRAGTRDQPDARDHRRGPVRRAAPRRVRNVSDVLLPLAGGEPARPPPLSRPSRARPHRQCAPARSDRAGCCARRRADDRGLRRRAHSGRAVDRAPAGVRQLAGLARRARPAARLRARRRPGPLRPRAPMSRRRIRGPRRRARRRHDRLARRGAPRGDDRHRRARKRSDPMSSTCASATSTSPGTSPAH